MNRFAGEIPVFFFEEPVISNDRSHLEVCQRDENLFVVAPHISRKDREDGKEIKLQHEMLNDVILWKDLSDILLWYYAPKAVQFAKHINARAAVFDCVDDLAAFRSARPELPENEKELLENADLVFTGGYGLYEAMRDLHPQVFPFPSGIDVEASWDKTWSEMVELIEKTNAPKARSAEQAA